MFAEIALIVVCVAIPFFCLFSFREGLRYGGKKPEKIDDPVKAIKKKLEAGKQEKEAKSKLRELDTISKNLLNYNGTSEGQVKVNEGK